MPIESRITRKQRRLNDASVDVSGGMAVVLAATVLALEAKSRVGADGAGRGDKGRGRGRGKGKKGGDGLPATGKVMSLFAATLGPSSGVATGRKDCGGFVVALPCVSARRSRLFPEVFDERSSVSRRLSTREEPSSWN